MFEFLGIIPFAQALEAEAAAFEQVRSGAVAAKILGFECQPVITLGVRGRAEADIYLSPEEASRLKVEIFHVKRGGQATLHVPGQLVIFPIQPIHELGVRRWIELLAETTVQTLEQFGVKSFYDPCKPGVYTSQGKIMALGIQVRRGISIHGISINVCNDLSAYEWIRPCGMEKAAVDRVVNSQPGLLPLDVWTVWCGRFKMPGN